MFDIADALVSRGWAVDPLFLDPASVAALRDEVAAADGVAAFRPAGIGRGTGAAIRPDVRKDRILWLEPPHPLLERFEGLRVALNRSLFLGLRELECHFAIYPPAGFYRKHLDRHQSSDARVVSVVLYLNESWAEADGGLLRLYERDAPDRLAATVVPRAGTLACFMSDSIWHEVTETGRERLSVTGWFRR